MVFKRVRLKKRLFSCSTTSFFFTDIVLMVNFDRICLQLNTSRLQGNVDVIFEFVESKILTKGILKTGVYFKQKLSKKIQYLAGLPPVINLLFFNNAIEYERAWSQRLIFSGFSYLYDTYHWSKFQKSARGKSDMS